MLQVEPGDVFVVKGKGNISYAIRTVGWFWSSDAECSYNHAGIVIDSKGTTFESLNRISKANLKDYIGCEILIARHIDMNEERFRKGWLAIKKFDGVIYPWWRLGLHLLHIARFFHPSGIPVCSELSGMFEAYAGLRKVYWGLTPDNLADEYRISKYYLVKFQGVFKGLE